MESKYNYELIRDYLHGVVDQETARRMRELIRTDEVARNIAAGILQLEHEFDGDDAKIESYIEEVRQKQLKQIGEHNKTRVMSPGWVRIAAAILIIAIAAPVLWLTLFQNDIVADELKDPYPLAMLDRGSATDAAFELYLNKEYSKAAIAFGDRSDDATVIFYKGLSLLYAGEYEKAASVLETSKQSRYNQQAWWFQTLALIKAGNSNEAKKNLEQIIQNPSHYKSSSALRLLEELK